MTDTNCWLTYKLRPDKNPGTMNDTDRQPNLIRAASDRCTVRLPSVFQNGWYWTSKLRGWCDSVGIPYANEDGGTLITAAVGRSQVEAFIAFVYDEDPDYKDSSQMQLRPERAGQLAELKADVEQRMDPEAIHELLADEW